MTLLTLTETAQMLKVSPRTVRRLPMPRAYVGGQLRYDLADVEAYVQSRKAGGAQMGVLTIAGVSVPVPPVQTLESMIIPKEISGTSPPRLVKHRNPLYSIGGKR